MTHKQKKFVEAYLGEANGNATEAARIAGYKGNDATLRAIGSQNLTKLNITEAVNERVEQIEITTDYILSGVKAIAETENAKHSDKLRALELLGKYKALWTEKTDLTGKVTFGWDDDPELPEG